MKDSRNAEVVGLLRPSSALALLHGRCMAMGLADDAFVFKGYIWVACCVLPLGSVAFGLGAWMTRRWHGGQVTLFIVASGAMSFVQLLLIGRATAI